MDAENNCFSFDDVVVDPPGSRVFKAGKRVALEPKAFRVLVYLLERQGRVVEKSALLSAIWPDTFVTENALTRSVALLRKTLGDNKSPAKYIETVPTRGYRFIAEISKLPPSALPLQGNGHSSSLRKVSSIALIGLIALLTLGIAGAVYLRTRSTPAHFALTSGVRLIQATNSTGVDLDPSFSPDGNSLVYSSDESGSFELYVRQLTREGRVVALTHDGGRNLQPSWSPDGSTIAYTSQAKGGIWLIPAIGGAPRRLTANGCSPAWSPDGTQIAFQTAAVRDIGASASVAVFNSTIQIVSLSDGKIRSLTQTDKPAGTHNSPAWSPDGRSIVFISSGLLSISSLWKISVADSLLTYIGTAPGLFEPVFSADGTSIFVTAAGSLREIPASARGADYRALSRKILDFPPDTIRYAAISRDGKKLAFGRIQTRSNIYSLPMSGDSPSGSPQPLIRDTRIRKTSPVISQDSRHILFNVSSLDLSGGIWMSGTDGSDAQLITGSCGWSGWLPGNHEFLCTELFQNQGTQLWESGRFQERIWKVDVATRHRELVRTIDRPGQAFSFSPDGKSAAFFSADKGVANLWVAPIPSGPPQQITFEKNPVGFPSWSPDGKSLAGEEIRGNDAVVVLVRPGQPIMELTTAAGQNWPHSWSPDGNKIAFAAARDGVWNLRWISVSDRSEKQLTSYTGPAHFVRYPAWSSDRKMIVFEYAETTGNIWMLVRK